MSPEETVADDASPDLSIVVPTRERPVRLRWLLNALAEQTLPAERWEVIVAHDSDGETPRLLDRHPLARSGRLRAIRMDRACGPAEKRNAGWRRARGRTIVFTDDDCRPPPEWLEHLDHAVAHSAGSVVQGATQPDPDERYLIGVAPWWRTQQIDPPSALAQTCNITYPRELLERLGGFDETLPEAAGEDTDLRFRALAAGAEHVGAPAALTFHAVADHSLLAHARLASRWSGLAYLYKRHPELREDALLGVFWKERHALFLLAAAGALLGARRRGFLLLGAPYVLRLRPPRSGGPRAYARALLELPGHALIDAAEIAALTRGSIRYGTLFL